MNFSFEMRKHPCHNNKYIVKVMEWPWLTISLFSRLISSLVLPGPIVQLPLHLSFQLVALLRWGIQYIEGDFACIWFRSFSDRLKAWPPCWPPLPPCPVQFPGDPHSLPGWPGWSGLRVGQVGNRQGYHFQPLSCTQHSTESTDSDGAPPHLDCLPLSGAHRHPEDLVHERMNLHIFFPDLTN